MTHDAGEAAIRKGTVIAGWQKHNTDLFNKKLVEDRRLREIQKYGRERNPRQTLMLSSGDANFGEDFGDRRFMVLDTPE